MAWITPTFNAAQFYGMTAGGVAIPGAWTLAAGDVITNRYVLANRTITFALHLILTTVASAPQYLTVTFPQGRYSNMQAWVPVVASAGGVSVPAYGVINTGVDGSGIAFGRLDNATWGNSTNATYVSCILTFESTT